MKDRQNNNFELQFSKWEDVLLIEKNVMQLAENASLQLQ